MKGKKCIKYLILCITCLLSLSHCLDTKALQYNALNLAPTENHWTSVGTKVTTPAGYYLTDNNRHIRFSSTNLTLQGVTEIQFPSNINVKKDNFYLFTIGFQNYDVETPIIWNFESSDSNWQIMSIQPNSDQALKDNNACAKYVLSGHDYLCQQSISNRTTVYFDIIIKPYNDGSYRPRVYNSDTFFKFYYGLGVDTLIYISDIQEYKMTGVGADELNEKDEQDRQDIEQQSSDTEESADTASEDVGGATTNILGAINGFATAVTNIQAGTCILPEISAYGMSLGRLNLCTYSPPAWVQGLTSTILSLITLKMAISIFYRIMGLLDGVLGGKK